MAARKDAKGNRPDGTPDGTRPHPPGQPAIGQTPQPETGAQRDAARIQRQTERIREMERLMRAAAAFARGKPGR